MTPQRKIDIKDMGWGLFYGSYFGSLLVFTILHIVESVR
jgi:hypothetical protein